MKKILSLYNAHKKNCYLIAGLILSCLFMVPFLILGEGSIITYHDQLDGELFSYLLTAKYLFTDIRVYPEIMNGLPAAGAVPPAPLFVLLYVVFEPFTAFMISQWIIYLMAFLGMYLLLMRLTGREFISFSVAVIFMLLPFYPVYGLCIPGQPLLLFAVLSLLDQETSYDAPNSISTKIPDSNSNDHKKNQKSWFLSKSAILCCALILLYAASSSLVLVGFACLLLSGIFALYNTIAAYRRKIKVPRSPWLSFGVLLVTYLLTNFRLIRQVLFPESTYVSHKTEMVLSPQNFTDYFREAFTTGISYAQSYHISILILSILCLMICLLLYIIKLKHIKDVKSSKRASLPYNSSSLLFKISGIFLFILITCLFHAFYHESFITGLRNASNGILKTFNLDRVCWLLPTAWCILAGYLLCFIADLSENNTSPVYRGTISASPEDAVHSKATPRYSDNHTILTAWRSHMAHCTIFVILSVWGITVLLHSPLRPNLSKLLKGDDYYALDWKNFFAEDIFTQIDTAIGKPQESYHVISVGIYPAAAAYNGFHCLDGYSNNYPLEYKHAFRQIMEGELDKNDYVRDFFDNWGNRCYITTAEQANYYTFEKKWNSVIYDLDLNVDKLKEMDCRYIFSAAYLMNAEEKGLSLLQEAPFETEKSWYHIYVYVVD